MNKKPNGDAAGPVCSTRPPVDVATHLRGASFPATRDELSNLAKENNAPEAVVVALDNLPQEWFESPDEICTAWEALPDEDR